MDDQTPGAVKAPLEAPVRPACWIVEWGAISLPLGDPSRITAMLAHYTKQEAEQALAEVSEEFDAHMWMASDVDTERTVLAALPKPDVFDPGRFGVAWREEKVRAYAAQAVTAERKRFAAAVNAALPFCCQFAVDALMPFSGQAEGWYRASGDDAELADLPPLI